MEESTYMEIILKYLSGSISWEEKAKFNTWLESDDKNRKLFSLYEQIWNRQEREDEAVNMKTAWDRISEKAGIKLTFKESKANIKPVQTPKSHINFRYGYQILRYAAVLLVAVSLIFLFKKTTQTSQTPGQQQVLVQYGKQNNVILPDGSKVVLDAGSKLSFPKGFNGNLREVYLSGEAYFEVTHNQKKAFVVYANKGIITVLGTKFNVRAWKFDDNEVEVVVAEGSVSLRGKESEKENVVVINKGKMSCLTSTHLKPITPERVNIENHLAWMKRELFLENTPLNEVLDKLARWYDLQFELPSPVYDKVRLTGTFQKKSVNHILEAIGLMIHLDYKRENNKITFFQKK